MAATANVPSDNLYITGLPGNIDDNMVKQIFGQYSPVVQCKVLPQTQGDKRAAFARFEDVSAATWMIQQLNGNIPQGLTDPIKVTFAASPGQPNVVSGNAYGKVATSWGSSIQSSPYAAPGVQAGGTQAHDNLYITGLPETITEEELMKIFGKYGTITQAKVLGAKYGSTAALVRWASVSEATWVKDAMNGQTPPGLQTPVEVRFADNPQGKPPQAGQPQFKQWSQGAPQVVVGPKAVPKNPMDMDFIMQQFEASGALPGGTGFNNSEQIALYISGLPPSCTDLHLYRLFAPFGPIAPKGVRAVTNPDGSCKGFGFVNYLDMNAAQNAILIMNGAQLPDGTIMGVSVKAEKGGQSPGQIMLPQAAVESSTISFPEQTEQTLS